MLYEQFATRGYRFLEVSNVMYLEIAADTASGALPPGVTVRAADPHEVKLWTAPWPRASPSTFQSLRKFST